MYREKISWHFYNPQHLRIFILKAIKKGLSANLTLLKLRVEETLSSPSFFQVKKKQLTQWWFHWLCCCYGNLYVMIKKRYEPYYIRAWIHQSTETRI